MLPGFISAPPPPITAVARNPKEQVREVLDFYRFALRPDATYAGTVVFDVKASETNPSFLVSVRVDPKSKSVQTWEGLPPDGTYSCYTEVSRDDFFLVYSGAASVAQVGAMCFSGRIKVHWFRYYDLQQFASSFQYATPVWIDFFRRRGDVDKVHSLMQSQWMTARARPGTLVDEDGNLVDGASVADGARRDALLEAGRVFLGEPAPPRAAELATAAAAAAPAVAPVDAGATMLPPAQPLVEAANVQQHDAVTGMPGATTAPLELEAAQPPQQAEVLLQVDAAAAATQLQQEPPLSAAAVELLQPVAAAVSATVDGGAHDDGGRAIAAHVEAQSEVLLTAGVEPTEATLMMEGEETLRSTTTPSAAGVIVTTDTNAIVVPREAAVAPATAVGNAVEEDATAAVAPVVLVGAVSPPDDFGSSPTVGGAIATGGAGDGGVVASEGPATSVAAAPPSSSTIATPLAIEAAPPSLQPLELTAASSALGVEALPVDASTAGRPVLVLGVDVSPDDARHPLVVAAVASGDALTLPEVAPTGPSVSAVAHPAASSAAALLPADEAAAAAAAAEAAAAAVAVAVAGDPMTSVFTLHDRARMLALGMQYAGMPSQTVASVARARFVPLAQHLRDTLDAHAAAMPPPPPPPPPAAASIPAEGWLDGVTSWVGGLFYATLSPQPALAVRAAPAPAAAAASASAPAAPAQSLAARAALTTSLSQAISAEIASSESAVLSGSLIALLLRAQTCIVPLGSSSGSGASFPRGAPLRDLRALLQQLPAAAVLPPRAPARGFLRWLLSPASVPASAAASHSSSRSGSGSAPSIASAGDFFRRWHASAAACAPLDASDAVAPFVPHFFRELSPSARPPAPTPDAPHGPWRRDWCDDATTRALLRFARSLSLDDALAARADLVPPVMLDTRAGGGGGRGVRCCVSAAEQAGLLATARALDAAAAATLRPPRSSAGPSPARVPSHAAPADGVLLLEGDSLADPLQLALDASASSMLLAAAAASAPAFLHSAESEGEPSGGLWHPPASASGRQQQQQQLQHQQFVPLGRRAPRDGGGASATGDASAEEAFAAEAFTGNSLCAEEAYAARHGAVAAAAASRRPPLRPQQLGSSRAADEQEEEEPAAAAARHPPLQPPLAIAGSGSLQPQSFSDLRGGGGGAAQRRVALSRSAAAPPPLPDDDDPAATAELRGYVSSLRLRLGNEAARYREEDRWLLAREEEEAEEAAASGSRSGGGGYRLWGPRHPLLVPPTAVPTGTGAGAEGGGGAAAVRFGLSLSQGFAALPMFLPALSSLSSSATLARGGVEGAGCGSLPTVVPVSDLAAGVLRHWAAAAPDAPAADAAAAETAAYCLGFPLHWHGRRPVTLGALVLPPMGGPAQPPGAPQPPSLLPSPPLAAGAAASSDARGLFVPVWHPKQLRSSGSGSGGAAPALRSTAAAPSGSGGTAQPPLAASSFATKPVSVPLAAPSSSSGGPAAPPRGGGRATPVPATQRQQPQPPPPPPQQQQPPPRAPPAAAAPLRCAYDGLGSGVFVEAAVARVRMRQQQQLQQQQALAGVGEALDSSATRRSGGGSGSGGGGGDDSEERLERLPYAGRAVQQLLAAATPARVRDLARRLRGERALKVYLPHDEQPPPPRDGGGGAAAAAPPLAHAAPAGGSTGAP